MRKWLSSFGNEIQDESFFIQIVPSAIAVLLVDRWMLKEDEAGVEENACLLQ